MADMEVQGWFAATRDGPYGIVDMRRAAVAGDRAARRPDLHPVRPLALGRGRDGRVGRGAARLPPAHVRPDGRGDRRGLGRPRAPAAELVYGTADGADLLNNQFAYDPDNAEMDDEVRVLQARDADGDAIASLVNFSAHATVLGASNTRDLRRLGPARRPGHRRRRSAATVVTMVGTLGRSQPKVRDCDDARRATDEDLCKIDHYARLVRDKVADRAGRTPSRSPARRRSPPAPTWSRTRRRTRSCSACSTPATRSTRRSTAR